MVPFSAKSIQQLHHDQYSVAEEIQKVFYAAYTIEAQWLGVENFPPLFRKIEDIQKSVTSFYGVQHQKKLLAVAEIEKQEETLWNIDSFVVHPDSFRKGIGSLLLTFL